MENAIKNDWNKNSDKYYQNTINQGCYEIISKNPECAFPAAIYPLLKKYLNEFHGKKILVPSSGDNIAAFGFNLLGADVTSCDIAENQLKNAQEIANQNNWEIKFIHQDSMELDKIESNYYDLVYTSNGAHIWINDLVKMYKNFYRVLKHGGFNIFFETHPMSRPFDNSSYDVKITKHYADVFVYANDDVPEYLWRTQDFVNAICTAGFVIKEMQEFHSVREDLEAHNYLWISEEHKNKHDWHGDTFDWHNNPWAALPQCLCICSQK